MGFKPELRVRIDDGTDVIDVSSFVVQGSGVFSIDPEENSTAIKLTSNVRNLLPELGTQYRVIVDAKYEDEGVFTVLFDGLFDDLADDLIKSEIDSRSRDFTKIIFDNLATNAFENKDVVDIVRLLLDEHFPQFAYDLTTIPDQTVGQEVILDNYAFEDKVIFEIFEYLAQLIGRDFWVESDPDSDIRTFFFKVKQFDPTVKETFEVGVNLSGLVAIEDKNQMWNHIVVEGDRRQFETFQDLVGTIANIHNNIINNFFANYIEVTVYNPYDGSSFKS